MPNEVATAHPDFHGAAGLNVDRDLAQPALHPARDPDGDLCQGSAEMLRVQPAMEVLEPIQQAYISGASPFAAEWFLRYRSIRMDWEIEKLSFRGSPQRSGDPRIQKPDNGLQHIIRRKGIASVYSEDPPAQAQHHGLVRVGEHSFDIFETECL
jgi:hypothetical protein